MPGSASACKRAGAACHHPQASTERPAPRHHRHPQAPTERPAPRRAFRPAHAPFPRAPASRRQTGRRPVNAPPLPPGTTASHPPPGGPSGPPTHPRRAIWPAHTPSPRAPASRRQRAARPANAPPPLPSTATSSTTAPADAARQTGGKLRRRERAAAQLPLQADGLVPGLPGRLLRHFALPQGSAASIRCASASKSSRHFRRMAATFRAASSPSALRPPPGPSATPRRRASLSK